MRILELQCGNFRGFEKLSIAFDPEFTLIVGTNGAGKSSLLDAAAVALGGWLLGFPEATSRHIERDDVRRVMHVNEGLATLEPATPTHVSVEAEIQGERISWSRALTRLDGRTTRGDAAVIRSRAMAARRDVVAGQQVDLPVIAYYGTGRLWLQKRDRSERREQLGSREQGYEACLEPASDQVLFEAWMRWREQVRVQKMGEAITTGASPAAVRAPHLEAIEQAACSCVPGARAFRYDFSHQELRFSMEDGRELPFRLLSDGYRSLLAMVADIAWRAVVLNPHHGGDAARQARGVVLVDEIDLHLHPRWQRSVVASLRAAFPRIQFIATTHSPQVVSSAHGSWIRLLDEHGAVRRCDYAEGRDSNALLEDIFGTRARPDQTANELDQLFEAIDRHEYAAARSTLDRLTEQLGPDDADLVRARWLLDQEVAPT